MRRDPVRVTLLILFGLIVLISLLAPYLAPYDPLIEAGPSLAPPSVAYPLGTDLIGRDVFSRVLYGGGRTLLIGGIAVVLAIFPGTCLGLLAGYSGWGIDRLIQVLLDALLAIPPLVLALACIALLGNGPVQTAVSAGVVCLPPFARIVRGIARSLRSQPYIDAARGIGARADHILINHVLPNALRPLLAATRIVLTWAITLAAALHFLGFGGDPAIPEWGAMLAEARQIYRIAPWAALGPGLALTLILLLILMLEGPKDKY